MSKLAGEDKIINVLYNEFETNEMNERMNKINEIINISGVPYYFAHLDYSESGQQENNKTVR